MYQNSDGILEYFKFTRISRSYQSDKFRELIDQFYSSSKFS